MTRQSYELSLTRGDCFDLDLIYKADGVAVDLSGHTAEMAIVWPAGFTGQRKGAADSTSWDSGRLSLNAVIDAPNGKISFQMGQVDTGNLPPISEATYQVRLTKAGGCTTTILTGRIRVGQNLFEVTA